MFKGEQSEIPAASWTSFKDQILKMNLAQADTLDNFGEALEKVGPTNIYTQLYDELCSSGDPDQDGWSDLQRVPAMIDAAEYEGEPNRWTEAIHTLIAHRIGAFAATQSMRNTGEFNQILRKVARRALGAED